MAEQESSISLDELKKETVVVLRKTLNDGQYEATTIKSIEAVSTPRELYNAINMAILAFNITGVHRGDLNTIKGFIKTLNSK